MIKGMLDNAVTYAYIGFTVYCISNPVIGLVKTIVR